MRPLYLMLFILVACNSFQQKIEVTDITSGSDSDSEIISLSYQEKFFGGVNTTLVNLSPTVTGSNLSFSISPALPTGLSLNRTTGKITGVSSQIIDEQQYTITVQNKLGSKSTTIELSFLNGIVVDTFNAGTDDDGGANNICFSTAAAGCSLQAAIQTANGVAGKHLVILGAGSYSVDADSTVSEDLVIRGEGSGLTEIKPTVTHPGYKFISIGTNINLHLREVSVTEFGQLDGAVILLNDGNLKVEKIRAHNNNGVNGGVFAIYNNSNMNVLDSTFENNSSSSFGGIIHSDGSATGTFQRCYFTNNRSHWGSVAHAGDNSLLTFLDSTMFANISDSNGTLASPSGDYILRNITMAFNTNSGGGAAGLYFHSSNTHYTIENSIIAFNTQSNLVENNCLQNDPNATMTSLGHNIFSDSAGNCAVDLDVTDILSTDPLLSSMTPQNNGGYTLSFALSPTSPAINAGNNSCSTKDQTNFVHIDASCDIGSVEFR